MAGIERKIRLQDIAKLAGVSRAVVGHVLNQSGMSSVRVSAETRKKVLKIAEGLDYRPNRTAQRLRGMPSKLIGVLLNTVNVSVFSARLAAIEAEAQSRGYRLMIGQTHQDLLQIKSYLDDFEEYGIDVTVCLFDVMHELRLKLKKVFQHRDKIIFHSSPIIQQYPCVKVDTSLAIELLVNHLIENKRKRIALQLWSSDDLLMTIRQDSWKNSLQKHKLSTSQQLIWTNPDNSQKPTREMIDDCIQKLVIKHKADAIIASNDEWAVRIIQGLQRHGLKVPHDIAVTGYDNLEIADVIEPALTTIDQCHQQYACEILNLAEDIINDRITSSTRLRVIAPKLIVRESSVFA